MYRQYLEYLFIRILMFPFGFMPPFLLQTFGKIFGLLGYYLIPKYRKRTLSNISLAKNLNIGKSQLKKIAKKSFINLAINCLEYQKLSQMKNVSKLIHCENPELPQPVCNQKKGIVFFCGHQANWETLFLDGTLRMRGVAIGKPIKNPYLYNWINKIREKTGGQVISHKNALKESLKALKKNKFVGILADQGMPESSYFFNFFGRKAWSTTAPALLSYKSGAPIIIATIRREKKIYKIRYSEPIWPDANSPKEEEIKRLMNICFKQLEKSIAKNPDQWLWQHNRWKQQSPHFIFKRFRKDCILIVLPSDESEFFSIKAHLVTLKKIYSKEFLFLLAPKKFSHESFIPVEEIFFYENDAQMRLQDFRFKLVYNFSKNTTLKKYYLQLSAFDVFGIDELKKIALRNCPKTDMLNLSEILQNALCRQKTICQ